MTPKIEYIIMSCMFTYDRGIYFPLTLFGKRSRSCLENGRGPGTVLARTYTFDIE